MRAFLANKLALVGSFITGFVLLAVIIGPWLSPYSPTDADFLALLAPPSLAHPFGTDSFGRDVLTRVLYGARVSLVVSASGVLAAALLGCSAGLVSAYFGGWSASILMRISDLLFSFPSFVLALFLVVVLGFGATNIAASIALDLPSVIRPPRPQHGTRRERGGVGAGGAPDGAVHLQHSRPRDPAEYCGAAVRTVRARGRIRYRDRGRLELYWSRRAAAQPISRHDHGGWARVLSTRAVGAYAIRRRDLDCIARSQPAERWNSGRDGSEVEGAAMTVPALLDVVNLRTAFVVGNERVEAVRGITFSIDARRDIRADRRIRIGQDRHRPFPAAS